jgi:tyrocidine synthetase-3
MIPSYIIPIKNIPLNPNGKVDRRALPEPETRVAGPAYCAPRNPLEEKLAAIWSEVLHTPRPIGIDDNFFEIGGHSLKATLLMSKIHQVFDVKLQLTEIFVHPFIRQLAASIEASAKDDFIFIPPTEKKDYYPLAAAQERLYLLYQIAPQSIGYNIPVAMEVEGEIHKEKFENTLKELIHRHESLRTSFEMVDEKPVQRIWTAVEFEIEDEEVEAEVKVEEERSSCLEGTRGLAPLSIDPAVRNPQPAATLISSFIRPFDLTRAPLMRAGLIKIEKGKYIFILDMHHIISDGTSMGILVQEFMDLYKREELPVSRVQYRDYSAWQHREKEREALKQQEAFWLREFEDEIPILDLPIDYIRPKVQDFAGSTLSFEIDSKETRTLNTLSLQEGATLFMVLLALYEIFLAKISSQEVVVVGTPTAGRRHAGSDPIIGMFINTLPLKGEPTGEKTFREFLKEVKEKTLQAFANQDYQYEELVGRVAVNRDTGRNPLFDTMLVLQNLDIPEIEIPGLKLKTYQYEPGISKFDLMLQCIETGDHLSLIFEYSTKLFKEETIEKFTGYFKEVVSTVLESPGSKISAVEIIPAEEKNWLLFDFNRTAAEYPREKPIHQLFARQAEQYPDHTALVGREGGKGRRVEGKNISITYGELNKKARQLAGILTDQGVTNDTVVGLLVEPGVEMMIGMIGILKAGGAYLPLDPAIPSGRIAYMIKDAALTIILTNKETAVKEVFAGKIIDLHRREIYNGSPGNYANETRPHHMAYVIYTSGSTGQPKGTAVEHSQLVNFVYHMYNHYEREVNFHDRCLSLTNIMFDVSVWEFFLPLSFGAQLVLLPEEKRFDVLALAQVIFREEITLIYLPPGLLKPVNEELRKESDKYKLKLNKMLVGVEPIRDDVLEAYMRLNPKMRIINGYGPTETTICATSLNYSPHPPRGEIVPIGVPLANNQVVLSDSAGHIVPRGTAGEICISGDGVSRGYINNPELTAEKFNHDLWDLWDYRDEEAPFGHIINAFGEGEAHELHELTRIETTSNQKLLRGVPDASRGGFLEKSPVKHLARRRQKIYKTGDLARLLPEGNIRFIGRRDQQLKLRGYRIEIGEIENRLLKHPGIKQALVQAQTDEQAGKYLCAYLVTSTKLELPALREYLSKDLPDYMIPSYFVPLEKIPLTANGKVDGKALPKPRIELEPQNYTAPRDKIEKKLVEIWSAVLGIEMEKIGIDENFFHLGGHSLKATQMATKIQKEMDVNVPLTEIFKTSHIRGLAAYIKKSAAVKYIPIEPVEKKDYYSLSSAQKRLFILQQIDKQGIVYNIPSPWKLEGFIDKEILQETFLKLVQRHESLRTSFHLLENEPVQRIHDEVAFEIEYYDIKEGTMGLAPLSLDPAARSRQSAADIISSFIRPFDLSCAPLLRIGLIKLLHNPTALHGHPSQEGKEARYLLVVDMHHIISDGTSIQVLIKDFTALYEDRNLPLPGLQYKDFSGWQNSSQQKAAIKKQEQYWMKEFGNEIPVLDLPTDFTRPLVQDFAGSALTFETGQDETRALKSLAQEQRTTLFMVLLSLYTIFLAKLGRQEDIVVGTPIAGRRHPGLEPIIGMFVNTLALRNYPVGEKRFKDFLKEVKENASTAFKNQDYPFEELVKLLGIERDIGRNPLFDVMFAMQNLEMETKKIEIGDLRLTPYRYQGRVSRVDLSFACQESKQNLSFTIEYSTKLFKEETITRFVDYFKKIISSIVEAPGNKISRVEIITAEEKKQILSDFNNPKAQYPQDKTIHGLFAGQVEQTPDHIAAAAPAEKEYMVHITHMTYISYRELNRKSHQLAVILKEKGVGANDIIAIQIERSLEMIIAILGILKADCAYLPIDPDSPGERSKYILNDSNAKLLVKKGSATPTHSRSDRCRSFEGVISKACRKNKVSEGISKKSNSTINPILETSIAVIFIDEVLNKISPKNVFSHPRLTPAPVTSLAYIIYTSGSTGRPKGVPISHMNFSPLVHWGYDILGIGPGDRVVQNLSYFFDWSVWEIFMSLTTGSVLLMVSAEAILNPRQYIDFMEYHQVTVLHITPTHFQALVKEGSKLNTLKYLAIGAEKLTFDLLERSFEMVNRDCRVFNMYGPTEATIMSAVLEAPRREEGTFSAYSGLTSVPIGVPIANLCLLVVDRYFSLCPVFVPGELLIAGSGLSRGYLNNPELTAEKFKRAVISHSSFVIGSSKSFPNDQCPMTNDRSSKLYRTGDLARWLYNGNIEFLGRLDQQLKIRGFRIELGEIENQLLNYPGINEAVVVVKENKFQDKRLYAYIVTGKSFDGTALEEALAKALPEYMIPSSFIRLESMPLNPNGKIDHKALPEPEIEVGDDYTPPRTEIEKKLTQIWSEILEIEQNLIGINSNFFKIGGHSLKAARLTARIDKELKVKVPMAEIFRTLSIRGLAKFIESTAKTSYSPLKAAEKKEYYPVSSAQKRLYVLQRMAEGKTGIVYNIPSVITAQGEIDKEKLEKTFMELIERHESLRTSFEMLESEPVQKVHEEVESEIEYYQVEVKEEQSSRLEGTRGLAPLPPEPTARGPQSAADIISSFIRPFDLSRAPLLRVGLTRLEEKKHLLMVDIHHIISDGISIAIVMQEFTLLQAGRELPRLELHYKDYAQWQADNNQWRKMQKQQEYWCRQYQGEIPRLNLPTDFDRSAAPMFAGDTLRFEIGPRETKALNQLAHEEDATMYMVLQALLDILLYKMTGQQDIIIGTVVAGRSHPALEGITGMFVNTLALRNYPAGEKTASQFIQEVKTRTLEAFENQDYPFAELVDQLGGPGKTGYNPLFDVMFTVNNIDMQPLEIPGLKLTPHPLDTKTAKFDLTLTVYTGDTLVIDMEYRTQLFAKQRMQRYAGYFKEIAAAVLENRETRLADISISVDLIEARNIEMEETFDF